MGGHAGCTRRHHGIPGPAPAGDEGDSSVTLTTDQAAGPRTPVTDEARRAGLRQMRRVATGLLLLMAVVYEIGRASCRERV